MKISRMAPLFLALLLTPLSAEEKAGTPVTVLDFDNDGRISRLELMAGLEFWSTAAEKPTLLRDFRDKPPASEADPRISDLTRTVHFPVLLRSRGLKDQPHYAPASLNPDWLALDSAELRPAAKPPAATQKYVRMKDSPVLKLRRDADDLSAEPEARKGALLSFAHDFTADADQWLARGVFSVGGNFELNEKYMDSIGPDSPDLPFWDTYGLHANFLFDHVQGAGGAEPQSDIFEFSASLYGLTMPVAESMSFILKADVIDSTSSDFDSHLFGGSFELEPVLPDAGLHKVISIGAVGKITGRVKLRAEGGSLISGEPDPASHKDDSFFRLGPAAELAFFPAGLDGMMKLYAKGSWLADLHGGGSDSELFVAGLSYSLPVKLFRSATDSGDISGSLSLNVEYRNGELPFSGKRDESLVVGLSILF